MYLIASHKKGISSVQLAKDLGVTQKTAWFMLHRIREALKDNNPAMLSGTIEADETYLSRKYRSDYNGLSDEKIEYNLANPYLGKGVVFGMAQRDGRVIARSFNDIGAEPIRQAIKENVTPGSNLYTDEAKIYKRDLTEYKQETVFHGRKEWVRGDVTVNHIENFFGVMKRGIYGIYHQISYKHCQRYCDEFAARYNTRDIKDGQRFSLVLGNIEGRLTYKRLVYGEGKEGSKEESTQTTGE
jgi:transposase-like protein